MKHKLLAALGAILIFSGAMSLISAKNYAASLNKVVLTDTHTGVLRTKTDTEGWLHFAASETVELPEAVPAPLQAGDTVGTLTVSREGETLLTVPIVAAETVEALTWREMTARLLRMAIFCE